MNISASLSPVRGNARNVCFWAFSGVSFGVEKFASGCGALVGRIKVRGPDFWGIRLYFGLEKLGWDLPP